MNGEERLKASYSRLYANGKITRALYDKLVSAFDTISEKDMQRIKDEAITEVQQEVQNGLL